MEIVLRETESLGTYLNVQLSKRLQPLQFINWLFNEFTDSPRGTA